MRLLLITATLALGAACSQGKAELDEASPQEDDTGIEDDETGFFDSDLPVTEPTYWSLDGELVVASGAANANASTVTVGYWEGTDLLCSTTVAVDSATVLVNDDSDLPLFGWWAITLGDADDCLGYPAISGLLHLGIGAWDPRLNPAASSQSLDGSALYGLYLQDASAQGPVFVYGAAGTTAHFDGVAVPVTEAPLPDGTYTLRGLHLLPILE